MAYPRAPSTKVAAMTDEAVSPARRALDAEMHDIARGDPDRYRLLLESLRRLAEGVAGPDLREMAREVLAGRLTLRRAVLSGAYAEAWRPHAERLIGWQAHM